MKIKLYILFVSCFTMLFSISCSSDDAGETMDSVYMPSDVNNSIRQDEDFLEFVSAKLRINEEVFNSLEKNRLNELVKGDDYKINFVKREGDFIQINLSYSGGCQNHSFELIWDGKVYIDDPCHMNFILLHDGNNDDCEAYITETITINLDALVGNVSYKNDCSYYIFSTYNSNKNADAIVRGMN
ncbi:hypothetical protein [Lutibacter citreus]|uniref:hypothetical protein n=1 Tax=Lutibacter citreus TaxID=2138210 RepID=UPI0013001B57|nr:hypothetical protein [Lutibacter citreus]